MQVTESPLTEEHKAILDAQLRQISDRLTIERLSEILPPIKQLEEANKILLKYLHQVVIVFAYRNEFTLILDEDGKNKFGQTQEEALADVNNLINSIVQLQAGNQ